MPTGPAQATLVGDTVDVRVERGSGGTTNIPYSASAGVVDPGPVNTGLPDGEFNLVGWTNLNTIIDIGAASIRIEHAATGALAFTGFTLYSIVISNLDWSGDPAGVITGINVVSDKVYDLSASAYDPAFSNATFDDHSVTIDVAGYRFDNGTFIDITLSTSDDTVAVAEPATLLLFGFGLAALGGVMRWR